MMAGPIEPTEVKLNEKIADIREWLVRIDTKVDFLNEVKSKADQAEAKADRALLVAHDNAADIASLDTRMAKQVDEIKANDKWKWSAILTIAGLLVSIGIAFLN